MKPFPDDGFHKAGAILQIRDIKFRVDKEYGIGPFQDIGNDFELVDDAIDISKNELSPFDQGLHAVAAFVVATSLDLHGNSRGLIRIVEPGCPALHFYTPPKFVWFARVLLIPIHARVYHIRYPGYLLFVRKGFYKLAKRLFPFSDNPIAQTEIFQYGYGRYCEGATAHYYWDVRDHFFYFRNDLLYLGEKIECLIIIPLEVSILLT